LCALIVKFNEIFYKNFISPSRLISFLMHRRNDNKVWLFYVSNIQGFNRKRSV